MPRNTDQIRVNLRVTTNANKIRHEVRDGRNYIIVPSATLPDDIVMNGILYPAQEIEKSYMQLERSPAPLGHPKVNSLFVSARQPEGINQGWFGAWNENVRRENGRVLLDKVIDVEVAKETDRGRRALDAINAAVESDTPIHTSTGIFMTRKKAPEGAEYNWVASNMIMDHDAILLDEAGAATPEQGVGLMVNSKGESEEVVVVNSELEYIRDDIRHAINFAVDSAKRAEQMRKNEGLVNKVMAYLSELLSSNPEAAGLTTNEANEEDEMTVSKEDFDKLAAKVDTLVANQDKAPSIADQVAEALKPLTERMDALQTNEKQKEQVERDGLVKTIVEASLLSEDSAKELTTNALRELSGKVTQGSPGAGASSHFQPNSGEKDPWEGYDMNANIEEK